MAGEQSGERKSRYLYGEYPPLRDKAAQGATRGNPWRAERNPFDRPSQAYSQKSNPWKPNSDVEKFSYPELDGQDEDVDLYVEREPAGIEGVPVNVSPHAGRSVYTPPERDGTVYDDRVYGYEPAHFDAPQPSRLPYQRYGVPPESNAWPGGGTRRPYPSWPQRGGWPRW